MKKLIILIGLVVLNNAQADQVARMPMEDYLKTKNDYMYEIKTSNYQKVILDCQGFIMGLNFYSNNHLERKIVMDEGTCNEVNDFLSTSKMDDDPVCLELNVDKNTIVFSRKTDECH